MKLQIVTIRDLKTNTYSAPQFIHTIGGYLRGMGDVVNGPKENDLAKHPEDFEVWHLGEWCDNTGRWELKETPISLGQVTNFLTTK